MGSNKPKVSIVTPVHNGIEDTISCLRSLAAVCYDNFEVIIVDDGSTDGSGSIITSDFPQVRVLSGDGNLWWSGGTNMGIRDALSRDTDFILTMNNDVRVAPDFLDALIGCALDNPGAIVGGKIYFLDDPDCIWSAGGKLSWWNGKTLVMLGHGQHDSAIFSTRRRVDFFTGMCVLIPAHVFEQIGYYDAGVFPQYHADSEFILRARSSGVPIWFEPAARVWNRVESTFMQRYLRQTRIGPLGRIKELLTSFRSPMNVRQYWELHRRYCPPLLIPLAFILRMARLLVFICRIEFALIRGGKALERIGA